MYIHISALGMPFNGDTIPNGKSLGGSESAAYYIAKELAKLGNQIVVWTTQQLDPNSTAVFDGVQYEWCGDISEQTPLGERFHFAIKTPHDVCIIQRHPSAFNARPNSKLNIWWLHDLALHRSIPHIQHSLTNIDSVFTVSEWHKNQVSSVYGIDKDFIYATKNGVDYDQIGEALTEHNPSKKDMKALLFASRPERGLEALVMPNGIMERLSDYHLYVCGYDNTTEEMAQYYAQLYDRCNQLPNVTNIGHLGKADLYKKMAECAVIVYPTMFEDTSNILCMEGAACGTPFVGMINGALPETTRFRSSNNSFASLLTSMDNQINIPSFVFAIKSLCENEDNYDKKVSAAKKFFQSWSGIAFDWSNFFEKSLKAKSSNKHNLIKHYEEMSDIVAMRYHFSDDEIEQVLPNFKTDYKFLIENDFAGHYKRLYEYERDRGQIYGPESLDNNARFEAIFDIVNKSGAEKVLDFGCAHGHYTNNLAKRLRDRSFYGLDIADLNVAAAKKWAEEENITNATFEQGDQESIKGKYDLIIAAEVLEHVEDPALTVDILMDHLNSKGIMVISVPYGPWEAIGYDKHPGWRAHIHHFEYQDLRELFGHFDSYHCIALPFTDVLGHYVLAFEKPDDNRICGTVDYIRKNKQQAPKQSLSVCMIAKDESNSLGKCLKALKPYADEIIIGIDKTTTDNTKEIAKQYNAETFEIECPLASGFDEARNATIEKAKHDWILWIDADESLENIESLAPYLRNNHFNGYLVKQHHFAVEPPAILQTDLPCRFFRNNKDIKFFGRIHEHPSILADMNAGPGAIYILPNIHISHMGYLTENKRRKRFERNFPILLRDRQDYPERLLGKFLYIRDLAHSIRYEREHLNGNITNRSIDAAKLANSLWKDLLINNGEEHLRYILESLQYVSECNAIIGGRIQLDTTINGIKAQGLFTDAATVKQLVSAIANSAFKICDEKYF